VVGGQAALTEAVVPAPKSETQEVTPAGDPE
jgi:hypothetical protein